MHDPSDPRDVVIPLVTWSGGGKTSVPITGFVHLWLTSISGQGKSLTITGVLFKGAGTVNVGNQGNPPANPTIFQVVLIK